jgi:hypothetical protein
MWGCSLQGICLAVLHCAACTVGSRACAMMTAYLARHWQGIGWVPCHAVGVAVLPDEQCWCVLAGVEVWVLAQSAVGIGAGIPAAAEMVCKGNTLRGPKDLDMTVRLAAMHVSACAPLIATGSHCPQTPHHTLNWALSAA